MLPATLSPRTLTVDRLAIRRGEREVVSGVSFSAGPGQIALLRGPNGAGKSSLLLTLAGAIRPASGTISIDGRSADDAPGEDMLLIGHLPALKPALTVTENLSFWADLNGDDPARIPAALGEAGLGDLMSLPGGYLSAGQTRRLSLSRLLVSDRPIWLLDEPTASLDTAGERFVGDMLARHLSRGGIAVAATHLDITGLDPASIVTVAVGGR